MARYGARTHADFVWLVSRSGAYVPDWVHSARRARLSCYRDQPPIPERVVADAKVLFTRNDIVGGMNVFQRYGVMEYGSVYGHGAYLGPDFTAEYLHKSAEFLINGYAGALVGGLSARERVAVELHENTYDPADGSLIWSAARGGAHRSMVEYYRSMFYAKQTRGGAQAEWITRENDVYKLTAFFAWTAWTATTDRPGLYLLVHQ